MNPINTHMAIPKFLEAIVTDVALTQDCKVKGPQPWAGIIIHHTGVGGRNYDQIDDALWKKLFTNLTGWLTAVDENYLSAHFHIGRFGECVMMANPDTLTTFHAGESSFFHPQLRKHVTGWNAYAIGIELTGDGNLGQYSDDQYRVLAKLCAALMKRYKHIDPRCVTGHENLTPRKQDPGVSFDWPRLFREIFAELRAPEQTDPVSAPA